MTQPTAERLAKGVVEAPVIDLREFRPWWGARTHLWLLHSSGLISWPAYLAGARFRELAEASRPGLRSSLGVLHSSGRGSHPEPTHRALDAVSALRGAWVALGSTRFLLVWCCAVDDRGWLETARRCGCHPQTVRRRTAKALEVLERASPW